MNSEKKERKEQKKRPRTTQGNVSHHIVDSESSAQNRDINLKSLEKLPREIKIFIQIPKPFCLFVINIKKRGSRTTTTTRSTRRRGLETKRNANEINQMGSSKSWMEGDSSHNMFMACWLFHCCTLCCLFHLSRCFSLSLSPFGPDKLVR